MPASKETVTQMLTAMDKHLTKWGFDSHQRAKFTSELCSALYQEVRGNSSVEATLRALNDKAAANYDNHP